MICTHSFRRDKAKRVDGRMGQAESETKPSGRAVHCSLPILAEQQSLRCDWITSISIKNWLGTASFAGLFQQWPHLSLPLFPFLVDLCNVNVFNISIWPNQPGSGRTAPRSQLVDSHALTILFLQLVSDQLSKAQISETVHSAWKSNGELFLAGQTPVYQLQKDWRELPVDLSCEASVHRVGAIIKWNCTVYFSDFPHLKLLLLLFRLLWSVTVQQSIMSPLVWDLIGLYNHIKLVQHEPPTFIRSSPQNQRLRSQFTIMFC